jgi:hypothetical protein
MTYPKAIVISAALIAAAIAFASHQPANALFENVGGRYAFINSGNGIFVGDTTTAQAWWCGYQMNGNGSQCKLMFRPN